MKILVTGAAGFIGFHLVERLVARGDEVVGLDSLNDYYDPRLKFGRLAEAGVNQAAIVYGKMVQSTKAVNYRFIQLKLEDKVAVNALFEAERFDAVCNLAAQAGVRYSLNNPMAYIDANVTGFLNILEACRHYDVKNLCFASSSSVYGLNQKYPFSTRDNVDHPISLYAATKKSNELMAHSYAHLFGIRATGLRFFTVYGPWGRPDMALFLFTKAALEGKSIDVYNNGEMLRDFTYIDDVVEAVVRVIDHPAQPDKNWTGVNPQQASSSAPYRIYNIGSNRPVKLLEFIEAIEKAVGLKIRKNMLPMQAADLPITYADVTDLISNLNYKPSTDLQSGVDEFANWFKAWYGWPSRK